MNICICGGGNLGHVCAGFLANRGHHVSILTTKPERWNTELKIVAPDKTFTGELALVTSKPEEVIPQAEMILVCLPGFAIHEELVNIKPYLSKDCIVGSVVSSTGFFFEAFAVLSSDISLFGFQRVPFISRIIEYGKKAELKGYKETLHVAIENATDKESIRKLFEKCYKDNLHSIWANQELYRQGNSKDTFYNILETNMRPVYESARRQGYQIWEL